MDGVNNVGRAKDFVLVGVGKSELEDLVKPFVAAQDRMIVPEPTPERGYYYRSDHFSFAKLGVPMLYGESGEDLRVGGKEAGKKASTTIPSTATTSRRTNMIPTGTGTARSRI
jgi:Zn-dependent M28 family amino/carboxypeptidase